MSRKALSSSMVLGIRNQPKDTDDYMKQHDSEAQANFDSAKELLNKALIECIDTTSSASELGRELTSEADNLIDELENFFKAAEPAEAGKVTVSADELIEIFDKFNTVLVQSVSLGRLCNTFHQILNHLTDVKRHLNAIPSASKQETKPTPSQQKTRNVQPASTEVVVREIAEIHYRLNATNS